MECQVLLLSSGRNSRMVESESDSVKSAGETETDSWDWPRREHLGQSIKWLLGLGLAWPKTLRLRLRLRLRLSVFYQAKLGRRLSQAAIVSKAQLVSKPVRPEWNTCMSAVFTQLAVKKFCQDKYWCIYRIHCHCVGWQYLCRRYLKYIVETNSKRLLF